jgi:hypothetical protein
MAEDGGAKRQLGLQASRERDRLIRGVRDQLLQFVEQKFAKERGRSLRDLGPDVACVIEGLADAMAMLHIDAVRPQPKGDGTILQKLGLVKDRR